MEKRRIIFSEYRKRCDILCLQETHSDDKTCGTWKAEWGGLCYFSHGTKKSCGVAIMVNRKYRGRTCNAKFDPQGRSVTVEVKDNEASMCIVNIYAPNKDSPMFFENKIKEGFKMNANLVVIGDFNTVLDCEKDRNIHCTTNNNRAADKVKELMEELKVTGYLAC